MLERSITIPPQSRSFTFTRESLNEDTRTVDVVFSTETDQVERWFGVEILDHNPKSVRMSRLNNKAALLLDHDSRNQIGVVESAKIEGKRGLATIRFSRSQAAEEIFNDVKDGIRSKISVGYRVHGMIAEGQRAKDGANKTDVYRVNDWEPFEVSIVSIPADDGAGIRADNTTIFGQRTAELSTTINMETPTEPQERALEIEAPATVTVEQAERSSVQVSAPLSENEINRLADVRAADEIDRRENLTDLARAFNVPDKDLKDAIRNKVSVDAFKVALVDQKRIENPSITVERMNENSPKAEPGTRAAMLTSFAEAAKPVLAARGINIIIPDYSKDREIQRNYIDGAGDQFHRSMTGAVTLVDVAKLDAGIGSPLISEVAVLAPETRVIPVDVISGSSVELSVNLTSATVAFRNANEGSLPGIGTFESRLFQTQVIETPVVIDIQGVLNASKDPARVMAAAARTVVEGALKHIGVQSFYGGTAQAGVDTKAAPGFLAQSNTASTHVVDADGSTALTSAYMMRLGEGHADYVWGNNTTLNIGEWMEETVESSAGYKLRALVAYLSGRVAPRLASKNSLVRIKKIGTDTGKKLTDLLLFDAYTKFTTLGQEPNAIFMGPRSLEQLRASRTATNPTGAPAPIPTDWNGIPIYITNSLSLAETV